MLRGFRWWGGASRVGLAGKLGVIYCWYCKWFNRGVEEQMGIEQIVEGKG